MALTATIHLMIRQPLYNYDDVQVVTAPYLLVGPQLTPTCSCSLFFVGIGSMTK